MSSNSGSSDGNRVCHPHIVDAGFPQRGKKILSREQKMYPVMVSELSKKASDGSDDDEFFDDDGDFDNDLTGGMKILTMEMLEKAFLSQISKSLPSASFLAGRCQPELLEDQERLTGLLKQTFASLPVNALRDKAVAYIEMAMSLALRGEVETAKDALQQVVTKKITSVGYIDLAAFYLAQLGDPSGYPAMLESLNNKNEFNRLMATRHLIGFQPYDGQTVGEHSVDIKAAFIKQLDDVNSYVQEEVPFLMAEAEIDGLREILENFCKRDISERASESAQAVIDALEL